MGFDWGSAVSGASTIVGDLLSFKSAKDANETNKRLVGENRQFEADMSNTAHQREVEDLRKAGLNPILSAGLTGSSTPTVQPARVDPVVKSNVVKSALDAVMSKELIKTEKTKQDLNVSASAKQAEDARLAKVDADFYNTTLGKIVNTSKKIMDVFGSGAGILGYGLGKYIKALDTNSKRPQMNVPVRRAKPGNYKIIPRGE